MRMKRMLAILMALCLLLSNAPAGALAAETVASGTCGDNLTWTLDSDGLLTVSGEGAMTEYGYTSATRSPWYSDDTVKKVVIEDGVTSIGAYAFYYCTNLTEVSIGKDVASIGSHAFEYCEGLKSITIPSGVQTIKAHAFDWCDALEEVILCDGLVSIEKYAFIDCRALTSLTIPASVTSIDDCAFWNCISVTGFWVDAENPAYSSDSYGVLFNKDKTTLINAPNMMSGSYTVPESVTALAKTAFRNCAWLTEIIIPDGVTSIGNFAFYECMNLTHIKLPAELTKISHQMMALCRSLKHLAIPENVTVIAEEAFMDCPSLTQISFAGDAPECDDAIFGIGDTIYYPAGNETWTEEAKAAISSTATWEAVTASGACGTNLFWVLDTDGLLTISGEGEMTEHPWTESYTSSITSVVIKEGVTSICGGAFSGCRNITTVTVADTVAAIGANAFNYCLSLETVNIPEGVESLGKGVFMDCPNLTVITIPDSVTEIDERAFCYSGLESVEIPASVASIGETAFYGCEALDEIVFLGDAPEFGSNIFTYVSAMAYYPMGNATWTEEVMQDYGGSLTWACRDAAGNLYGNNADDTTWALSGDTLTISGTGMLSDFAFRAAKHLVIEEGVTGIDICVFMADDWETVELASSVTIIGGEAFLYNESLTSVTIHGNGLATVDERAFCGCAALASLSFPASVTTVGAEAFGECESLTAVTFTGDAPSIGTDAFYGVTATVCYPAGNTTWTEEVMQDYGGNLTWIAYGAEAGAQFSISGTSVSLGDNLDLHFVIDPADVMTDYYAVLTRYYADGRENHVVTVPFGDWRALSDGRLYVTYSNIAAKEMGDYVEITVYNGNGEAVSELYVDSVKSYAMRMLGKEEVIANQELRTLYVDMLNYGAAAQAQFGYNVTMSANDLLTEEQQSYATASYDRADALVAGPGRAGTTLTLKNRITLDFIFSNSAIGSDYTGLCAMVTYTDHYGNAVETRINTIKIYSGSCGYVSVPGLAVADYGQTVTCIVYDAQGNALAWATDSIEGYAYRMQYRLPDIVDAIMKFGVSSYNYFH